MIWINEFYFYTVNVYIRFMSEYDFWQGHLIREKEVWVEERSWRPRSENVQEKKLFKVREKS